MDNTSRKPGRIPGMKPRYWASILSVAAVLFLIGLFALLLVQGQLLSSQLREQMDIVLELTDEIDAAAQQHIEARLRQHPAVIGGSIQYTSKEEALALMSRDLGEDLAALELPNPLFAVFTFNVQAAYFNADSLAALKAALLQLPGAHHIDYPEEQARQLGQGASTLGWWLLGLGLLLLLVALLLIHHTVRIALYANRFLLKTQELVGADWAFISRPYLRRSVGHGALSGLLAIATLALGQYWIRLQLPEVSSVQPLPLMAALAVVLLLIGILINWSSTYYTIRRYLKLDVEELYEMG